MHLLEVPESILLKIICQLGLKDILALGDSHKELFNIIYKSPSIWNNNGLLFPRGDKSITDKFIQRIIPRITRHYGVQELKMIDLPLTWIGYLMIFDQFAHTVNRIEIELGLESLEKLVDHLTVFAGNLAILQQNNRIPITFRRYALDDEEEFISALRDTEYLGQKTLHDLNDQFERMKLDDPPFERLRDFSIMVHGSQQLVNSMTMRRLELVASFLSGRHIRITTGPAAYAASSFTSTTINSSSRMYNKRQREHESTTATTAINNNKHTRHHSPKRQETHSLPSYSSFA